MRRGITKSKRHNGGKRCQVMATFEEFYESLPEDSNKRGEYFEKVFVPWFLKTDPEWSSQVKEIWLWDDYPQRWGKDKRDAEHG